MKPVKTSLGEVGFGVPDERAKMRAVKLGDLFGSDALKTLHRLLTECDWEHPEPLRKWLRDRKRQLAAKGVDADYLFYYLQP